MLCFTVAIVRESSVASIVAVLTGILEVETCKGLIIGKIIYIAASQFPSIFSFSFMRSIFHEIFEMKNATVRI